MNSNLLPRWRLQLTMLVFVAGLVSVGAQLPVYQFHPYWRVGAFVSESYLPPTALQISGTGDSVSVWWPYSVSNALLQTSSNCNADSWVTVTNSPEASQVLDRRTVILPATGSRQFFRLCGVETSQIPVFGFAIFYNEQLEFSQCATLTVRGRTHANGKICMGAARGETLTFKGLVTTASSIVVSNFFGLGPYSTPVYEGTPSPGYQTQQPTLRLPIYDTNNSAAAVRAIIELPPLGESANSELGQQRYFNKASVVLLVSNASVTMIVKNSGALTGSASNIVYYSASPSVTERTNLTRAFPFLSLTNQFMDYRENKRVMPTQIDMSILRDWLPNNSLVMSYYPAGLGLYPNILYVADFRTVTNLHAVRLVNGSIIPTNGPSAAQATGFTIATPNPLYVWGHYNCFDAAYLGTTNTTATFPASLVCDAITVLSPNWMDQTYGANTIVNGTDYSNPNNRNAANTTINAAIIAGTVYSTGSNIGQFSGGVQNLTRLIEDWKVCTLTLNASLVNLFDSAWATNQFRNPGNYYYAPIRNFNSDPNFNDPAKLPPGTPLVVGTTPIN